MKQNKHLEEAGNEAGYSLLEILVVLAIIGTLIGLVAPRLLGNVDKSKVVAAKSQAKNIRLALDSYKLDVGQYPTEEQGLAALVEAPQGFENNWYGPYLEDEVPLDPWNADFIYVGPSVGNNGQVISPVVISLGADSETGGSGINADIES
ncbi:type II secretion system major pseudopilin GspG [Litorimonas sp.]|jgi:general secretion pathway protein G|uniref:type II secretion system major pseudopilin GspG n=1 Tax=Litorimonas sp. TaxID=1892381 RepID=UPI003A85C53A